MLKLTIEFENKADLVEFLQGEAPQVAPEKKVAKKKPVKKAVEKPAKKETGEPVSEEVQVELREILRAVAKEKGPATARTFLESQGLSKISDLDATAEAYAGAMEALKAFKESLDE